MQPPRNTGAERFHPHTPSPHATPTLHPHTPSPHAIQAGGALFGPRLAPEYKPLQVWVGSWNANSLEPPFTPDKLRDWLLSGGGAWGAALGGPPGPFENLAAPSARRTASSCSPQTARPREAESDLYVIGFQELPDAQRGGISDAVPRLGHVRLGARATHTGSGKRHIHVPFHMNRQEKTGTGLSPQRTGLSPRVVWRGGRRRESGRGRESRVAEEVEARAAVRGEARGEGGGEGRGSEEVETPRAEGEKSGKRGASAKPCSSSAVGGGGKQRDRESHAGVPRGYAEMATVLSQVPPPHSPLQLPPWPHAWGASWHKAG